MTDPLPPISPEQPDHAAQVEALIDHAFGPGRYAKAAERLREGSWPRLDLSMVALEGDRVVGCSRIWPIHIGERRAMLLGPFAVAPKYRSKGLGGALVEACCHAAQAADEALVLLVGDAPYFEKLNFKPIDMTEVAMPGPVNPARVLIRELKPAAAEGLTGAVRAG